MGSIRFIFAVLAGMAIMSLTPALVAMTGGGQKGYTTVSVIYGLVFCAFTMITVFGVREMKPADKAAGSEAAGADASAEKQEKFSFGKSMVLLVKNKYFLIMLGIYLVNYTISGVAGSVGIYYTSYVLNNPGLLGLLSVASIIPMVVVLPITPKLTAKFGMQKACLYGSIISSVGAVIKRFCNNSVPVIMLGAVIQAAGTAPLIGTMYALVAEIAEYAFHKFKIRMDGTIYSCSSVGIKVGSGLGTAVVGWLLAAGHYDGAAAAQTQSAVTVIQGLYLIAPVVGAVLITLLLSLLKVEKANAEFKVQA
jgi:GPH family glycoside/pentoside/hexuronide:cation symporter